MSKGSFSFIRTLGIELSSCLSTISCGNVSLIKIIGDYNEYFLSCKDSKAKVCEIMKVSTDHLVAQ